jgi:uncharacterized protein YciI
LVRAEDLASDRTIDEEIKKLIAVICAFARLSTGCVGRYKTDVIHHGSKGAKVYLSRLTAAKTGMTVKGLTPEQTQIMQERLDHLKSLSDEALIVFAGRTLTNDETTFGIVMLRADSDAAAREIQSRDPGIQKGLFKATLSRFSSPHGNHTSSKYELSQSARYLRAVPERAALIEYSCTSLLRYRVRPFAHRPGFPTSLRLEVVT